MTKVKNTFFWIGNWESKKIDKLKKNKNGPAFASLGFMFVFYPDGISLLKINNRNTRMRRGY